MGDSKENSDFKECVILHVDDDMPDSTVFQRVLLSKAYAGTYRRVRSVKAAKDYFGRTGNYSDPILFPRPDIVVTELSIRGESGLNLIRWIRQKNEHREISIIAFSACKSAVRR